MVEEDEMRKNANRRCEMRGEERWNVSDQPRYLRIKDTYLWYAYDGDTISCGFANGSESEVIQIDKIMQTVRSASRF